MNRLYFSKIYLAASRGILHCSALTLKLWHAGSGVGAHTPGVELTSPALQGGFSTTRPPGKSPDFIV